MDVPTWVWWTTVVVTMTILLVDVVVIGRRPHEPSMKEVSAYLSLYVGLAILFGIGTGGFVLPHAPRDHRTFDTADGKAHFTVSPLRTIDVPSGHLLLQTLRSHDQYNTTIYGLDDRYRGITGGRRVIFVRPSDLERLGLADGDVVDLIADQFDDTVRRADGFRVVSYPTARGCAAAYYPETNPLVPLRSTADGSNTPTSKSVIVRLERAAPAS